MTPHINAQKGEIAKVVLMPGDPLRAQYFAKTFLENAKLVNTVRNMLMYTGTYKGKEVTIAGSGMGQSSMGIYSYELFHYYEVETIIRIGTTGAYVSELKPYDLVLVTESYSDSTSYAQAMLKLDQQVIKPTQALNEKLIAVAQNKKLKLMQGRVHCADAFGFYTLIPFEETVAKTKAICIDMESYALFVNALRLNKQAACLLTVSDSLVTHEETSPQEREQKFSQMLEIALGIL